MTLTATLAAYLGFDHVLSHLNGTLQPDQAVSPHAHHVEAAGGWHRVAPQVVTRGPNDALTLGGGHAGQGTTILLAVTQSDLDKHQGAVGCDHDEIDFPAPASGRPIMAVEQTQTLRLQVA